MTSNDMMTAFVASQTATPEPSAIEAATAKRMKAATINKAPLAEAEAAIAEAKVPVVPLFAVREAAMDGYGSIQRYGDALVATFGEGYSQLKKSDGGNAAITWAAVDLERKTFTAGLSARGVVNPAVQWSNAKKRDPHHPQYVGAERGTREAKALNVAYAEAATAAYTKGLRYAAFRAEAGMSVSAKDAKATELFKAVVELYDGKGGVAACAAKAAKPLPGVAKGG